MTPQEYPPIVCVAFPKWEGDYMKSTVQLMSELATRHRVLYVDYPYTWKDLVQGIRQPGTAPIGAMLGIRPALCDLQLDNGSTVHLLTLPPFLPANWLRSEAAYQRVLDYNAGIALPRIRRAMRQLDIERPLVVNAFNPALGTALAGQLHEQTLAYYCYDEISAAPWIGKHGARYENQFLQQADVTIVSSAQLQRDKSPLAQRCVLVKNGVGPYFFQEPGPRPQDLPTQGAIIGYLGSVDGRLDYDLLEQLAREQSDNSLVFVGRITDQAGAQRLRQLPNIHLLGSRPPQRLVDYVAAFDVALIPFVCNRLTAGIYPLKVNEYLATGRAVVATQFSDLSDFGDLIYTAPDTASFCAAVREALTEQDNFLVLRRRDLAQSNTWTARAHAFAEALQIPAPHAHQ